MTEQKFETDVIISGQNLKLTKTIPNIPITSEHFSDAYWLGWIKYNNLPTSYHISSFKANDGTCIFDDVTEQSDYPVGYCGFYMDSSGGINYSRTITLTNNGNSWTTATGALYPSSEVRLPNDLDVNTTACFRILIMIYGMAISGNDYGTVWTRIETDDPRLTETFVCNMYRANGTYTESQVTISLNNFENGAYEFTENGVAYKLAIVGWEPLYMRDILTNGNVSSYSTIHPMILVKDDMEREHLLGTMGSPYITSTQRFYWGSGEHYNGFYLNINTGAPYGGDIYNIYNNEIRYYGGMIGTYTINDLRNNVKNSYNIFYPENANFCIVGIFRDDICILHRIYTIGDLRKTIALSSRFSTTQENVYRNSANEYYAHVSEDNEFLGEMIDGTHLEPEGLRNWQIIGHTISENDYVPINSPVSTSLWSIKETNNEKVVANCFPYNKDDTGDGTFFAMIRSKISPDSITRDQNNNIVINDLSLILEDVVRKSADVKNEEDIPKTPTIATFNFSNINSSDFIGNENTNTILGDLKANNFSVREKKLIELKDNFLKQGFYKGQVSSYFHNYIASKKVKIEIRWYNLPQEPEESGWQIFIKNKNGEIVFESPIYLQYKILKIETSLPFFDNNGNALEYTVEEQIYRLENNWNVEISQRILKENATNSIIINKYIENRN